MKAQKLLALIGVLAILGGLGVAGFFFGGFFSVAADDRDPNIVNWAIIQVREASIARHAADRPPASLDDRDLVRAGARAYSELGCINCHGGPGVKPADFSEGLNPAPNLKKVIGKLLPQEVFWVIKNGIKMTGMPSFGAGKVIGKLLPQEVFWVIKNGIKMTGMPSFGAGKPSPAPDQEIWAVVAFLKNLQSVSDEDFKAWSAAPPGGH